MSVAWEATSGGASWRLELDRADLLPGRLVAGRVVITARRAIEARGVLVVLAGEEHWRYEVTVSDGKTSRTEVRTGRERLPLVPVRLSGPLRLAAGESRSFAFELPVPPLGPATLDATEAGVSWTVEARLDVPGGFDSAIEVPVRIHQPTALLRAGVVRVGEFALYPEADAEAGGITGDIRLDPVPLALGHPFTGRLTVRPGGAIELQEIRLELRVLVQATVSGGRKETITPWVTAVAQGMRLEGETTFEVAATLPDAALPTIELPHGAAAAELHLILARAWARDPHLARDVALATTREL